MVCIEIVKASIRLNFCEAYKGLKGFQTQRFRPYIFGVPILLMLPFSGLVIAQSNNPITPAKEISSTKQFNIVISASSAIAVDRFYGKALGLTRLPDENVEDAYPIMRYQLENSDVISELHFVIAREKLPRLKGGAGVARGFRLLSLSLPQAKKAVVLRRLHISGRNPILETRTSAGGEAYEFGSVFDADGNQIKIQFVSDKHFSIGRDLFQLGIFVKNQKSATQSIEKSIQTLLCDSKEAKDCDTKRIPIKIFQAEDGLDVWSVKPGEKIGYSLIQIQSDKTSKKHQELVKSKPAVIVDELTSSSATGAKFKNSFLLTLSDGFLLELIEP